MGIKGSARLTLKNDAGGLPGAFGPGCAQLLEGVDREHSLNRSAKSLGMAYSKAWRIVKEAEAQIGVTLLDRDGARGSALTDDGRRVLGAYRQLQREIDEMIEQRLPELF